MANTFGSYSPIVPLGTNWQESISLVDANGAPIDLTGLKVHAQLRALVPVAAAFVPTTVPILELTTPSFYTVLPSWPVRASFSIGTPTLGVITLNCAPDYSAIVSPLNAKVKLYWEIRLVAADGTVQPVVSGKVVFLPAVTF
jgi:hypothetical protein